MFDDRSISSSVVVLVHATVATQTQSVFLVSLETVWTIDFQACRLFRGCSFVMVLSANGNAVAQTPSLFDRVARADAQRTNDSIVSKLLDRLRNEINWPRRVPRPLDV